MPLTADDLEPSETALNCIRDGWFVEDCAFTAKLSKTLAASSNQTDNGTSATWQDLYSSDMAVGQRFCIKVEEVLCSGKSKFQVSTLLLPMAHCGRWYLYMCASKLHDKPSCCGATRTVIHSFSHVLLSCCLSTGYRCFSFHSLRCVSVAGRLYPSH